MSYILDALKKSERQRPPGPVPDLFTVQGPLPAPPRRPRWRLPVTAALLLLAVGLGIWIGTRSRREPLGAAPQPVAPPPHAAAPAAIETSPREAPVVRPILPPLPPTRKAAPQRSPIGAGAGSQVPPPAGPAAVPPPAISAPPVEAPREPSPAPPPAVPAAGPAPGSPPQPSSPEAQSDAAPPPSDGRILERGDLPETVRGEIKELRISGHVWSEDPVLRMVTIQDRLLREGAEVSPGLRLEEITPTGAVFGFKGYRFRLGGF